MTTTTEPADLTGRPAARHDGAYRGRRLSWKEFYELRPDLKPANDNRQPTQAGGKARLADASTADRRCPKAHVFPIQMLRVG